MAPFLKGSHTLFLGVARSTVSSWQWKKGLVTHSPLVAASPARVIAAVVSKVPKASVTQHLFWQCPPYSSCSQGPQPPQPLLRRHPSATTSSTSAPWSGYSSHLIPNLSNYLSSLFTLVTCVSKLTKPVPQLLSTSPSETHGGTAWGQSTGSFDEHITCPLLLCGAAHLSLWNQVRWSPFEFWRWSESPGPSLSIPPQLNWMCLLPTTSSAHTVLPSPRGLSSEEKTRTCLLFLSPLSSALPPWSRRIFYFQLSGNFPYGIFSLLYLMTQSSNTLSEASRFTFNIQMEAFWNLENTFLSQQSMNLKTLSLFVEQI